MGASETVSEPGKKDRWEKADIILKPIGALVTALTIAFVSFLASKHIDSSQEKEARTRLYTELMGKREDSESNLRKDMFSAVINTLMKGEISLDEKILQLELLAYNFHESLNLMPLFEYLDRQIPDENGKWNERQDYKGRLVKMSRAIIAKQISALSVVGKPTLFIYKDSVYNYNECSAFVGDGSDAVKSVSFFDTTAQKKITKGYRYDVYIDVLEYNISKLTAKVKLKINTFDYSTGRFSYRYPEFTVSYFEFPMIDNTRLENDNRLAVTMSCFNMDCENEMITAENISVYPGYLNRIEFKIIYFPGSHSSLKEKPYFDDIINKLLPKD